MCHSGVMIQQWQYNYAMCTVNTNTYFNMYSYCNIPQLRMRMEKNKLNN